MTTWRNGLRILLQLCIEPWLVYLSIEELIQVLEIQVGQPIHNWTSPLGRSRYGDCQHAASRPGPLRLRPLIYLPHYDPPRSLGASRGTNSAGPANCGLCNIAELFARSNGIYPSQSQSVCRAAGHSPNSGFPSPLGRTINQPRTPKTAFPITRTFLPTSIK